MAKKSKYEKVKGFYESGLWKEKRVRDAVKESWITKKEYQEITGEKYDES